MRLFQSKYQSVTAAYWVFVEKPEGKKPLGKPSHRWEDNIKMDLIFC
jgi:hypothetical protein